MAFADRERAEQIAERLRDAGYSTTIEPGQLTGFYIAAVKGNHTWWVPSEADANNLLAIAAEGKLEEGNPPDVSTGNKANLIAHLVRAHAWRDPTWLEDQDEERIREGHDHEHKHYQDELDHGAPIAEGNPPKVRTLELPKSGRLVTFEVQYGNPPKVDRQISARGGAIRYRTVKLPKGRYMTVAVTKEPGPRGGRTVAGEVKKAKS